MPKKRTTSDFYAAMSKTHAGVAAGPINGSALDRDVGIVAERATSLFGYQQYLTQARSWKAKSEGLPAGFEREVQAQAASALADTHALASATLRMTSQLKHSRGLDRMLSRWVATFKHTGPVHTSDLLSDLRSLPGLRQKLRDRGFSDDIWSSLLTNLNGVDGNLFVHEGKLAADLKVPGGDKTGRIVFAPSAAGMPRTLSELMRRGSFERQAALFMQNGAGSIQVVPGPQRDLELPEVVLVGSILSVRSMADHYRGLQDIGLATYTGRGLAAVAVIAAIVYLGVAIAFVVQCLHDPNGAECAAGSIMLVLAAVAVGAAAILFIGGLGSSLITPPSIPLNPAACPSGKICYDPATGEAVCC